MKYLFNELVFDTINTNLNLYTIMNSIQEVAISTNVTRVERDMIKNIILIAIDSKYSSF